MKLTEFFGDIVRSMNVRAFRGADFFRNHVRGWMVYSLIILTSVSFLAFFSPKITGDAYEYILMQECFRNHGSLDIRASDVCTAAESMLENSREASAVWLTQNVSGLFDSGKFVHLGFVLCPDGHYRSYHFWGYSFASLPFRYVCDLFDIDPIYSFILFHSLLLAWVLWSIYRCEVFGVIERIFFAVTFTVHSAVFYFDWIHTEYFSTVFLFVSILRLLEKRMAMSLLWVSVAALQNQPIAMAMPLIYLYFVVLDYKRKRNRWLIMFPVQSFRGWIITIFSAGIVLLPSIYYLLTYGHFNPIAAIGGVSAKWISLQRLFSLWFDLNQGVWIGFPGLLAGILLAMIWLLFSSRKRLQVRNARAIVCLSLIIIAISIPCLVQGNWNAGCATMVRYGSWIGILLIFILVLLVRVIPGFSKVIVLGISSCIQLVMCASVGVPADTDYLKFNKLSRWVFENYPDFYNPDPEIFVERLLNKEEGLSANNLYVFRSDNRITKILDTRHENNNFVRLSDDYCYVPSGEVNIKNCRDGWSYFNGSYQEVPVEKLMIRHDSGSVQWNGWFNPDPEYRWSVGHKSEMVFDLDERVENSVFLMRLKFTTYLSGRSVRILFNGNLAFEGVISYPIELSIALKQNWVNAGSNSIIFDMPRDERVESPFPGVCLEEIVFLYHDLSK
ncbi:MAG: hypothetical protein MI748_17865 [Opitutales bacterium]|nr:hypothetical protein [Opitutales bacterium]